MSTPSGSGPDFQLLFEASPAAALVLDPDLRIVAVSDAYLAATMTVRAEILGKDMFDVFPDDPDDPDATGVATLRESLHRVLAERQPDTMAVQRYDIRLPAPQSGTFVQRYWSPVNSPILDSSGEVIFVVHQVLDVTEFVLHRLAGDAARLDADTRTAEMEEEVFLRAQEIQRANASLRVSEERFRLLSQATSDAIWEWEVSTGELWLSESFEEMVGRRPGDISTVDAWNGLIHPDDRAVVLAQYQEAIASGAPGWALEYRLLHRSGNVVWVESRATIVREQDEGVARVVGGTRDLTARKETELRLQRQAELLDRASDAIVVRDLDDRITYWNAGAERLYGWTAEEARGQQDPAFRGQDEETYATAKALTLRAGEWSGEFRHVARDGRDVVVEARWNLLRDDRGAPEGVLVINTDVTERRRLEAHYLRSQRLESIGTLAGGIAHDLNNVLTPILMAAELLRDEVGSSAANEWLDVLDTSARRGADMVQQVLNFARGIEGRKEILDVAELAHDVVRLITDSFPKSITVTCESSDGSHVVTGDSTQLHQVLLNLCVNARDAMPAGGELTLHIEAVTIDDQYAAMAHDADPGEYVVVHVSDTGVGIAPTEIDRIFDPFFTTKEVGQGTGLGLATSHAIARGHGGFMNVYSELGRGSTFDVYLPASAAAAPERDLPPNVVHGARAGETILVVEDEPAVRFATKLTLESAGYRVLTATDGADGLATYAMRREEIDIVLTDMMMPVMDGAALTAALIRVDPDVRVVAASGLPPASATKVVPSLDVDHFLAKPYTADTLLATVRQRLDGTARPTPDRDADGGGRAL